MNTIKIRTALDNLEKGIIEKTLSYDELRTAILSFDSDLYELEEKIESAAEIAFILKERAGAEETELSQDTTERLIIGHNRTIALFNILTDYLSDTKAGFHE